MEKEKWTPLEEEFLAQNYYNYTIEELASKLNRTKCSVGSKAYFLLVKNGSRKKSDWTLDEINTLINNYDKLTYKELSELLNRSESSIYKKLINLNIDRTKCICWTEEEDSFLELNWGVKSIKWMAKELGRNPSAVRRRGYLKNFGGMYNTGYYLSVSEISSMLDVDSSTVYNWIKSKKLKSICRTFDRKKGIFIKFETFYEFLKENQNMWNATKLDYMVLNKEEDWLRKKRRDDDNKLTNNNKKPWTRKEEELLIKMITDKKSTDEMIKVLNRTKYSIGAKRKRLRKEKRI